jgi:hypothetical protein
MSTEADPGLNAARPHPLGVVAEYRVMGWNFPTGNEDLLYLVLTFYNISSLNEADYTQYRPGVREILLEQAQQFHALNNAQFGVTLPTEGYTIDPFFAAFAADPDVTNSAGVNFSSVNLPFAMGYAYHADFPRAAGWTFSPNIFGAPFFAGAGFVGIKYLKSATGPGEINLYSNTTNGGPFPDPNSAVRLYKYLSGTITPADGVACNQGDPLVTRICFIEDATPRDVRLLESSTPFALEAGQSASIVVSYIHAAPVQIPNYVGGTRVLPGDPTRLSNATLLSQGANRIDSLMGFNGFDDRNGDGIVQQNEFTTVPGSLLDKALVAQTIFDNAFLLPFAPEPPDFFLIPGNQQVTVVWKPSSTENDGDPYFQVSKDASVVPEGGGAPVPNALYDANYREFDVEGYRLYRGRADTPTALRLIAQYDYTGTVFSDFTGQVVADARGAQCAPELGETTTCAGVFDTPGPGVQLASHVDYDIEGNLVQVQIGNRTLLASGDVINLTTDTAVTGGGSGFPALSNSGVPFVYVDDDTRNGLAYFYAVTAFDVNSINSTGAGNTSLESARITKRVVPRTSAGNYVNTAGTESGLFGRGGLLTDTELPTIDPATGKFSKRFPISNGFEVSLVAVVKELLSTSGEVAVRLDSVTIVSSTADLGGQVDAMQHFTIIGSSGEESSLLVPKTVSPTNGTGHAEGSFTGVLTPDAALAARYGGGEGYGIGGSYELSWPGAYYNTIHSRGCVNGAAGFGSGRPCSFNGPRWFVGDQETVDHPNGNNPATFNRGLGSVTTSFSNGGALPGVATIFMPNSYEMVLATWRRVEGALSPFTGPADYRVYWGAGGAVDSVIDLTYDVPVPFAPTLGTSWGILNGSAVPTGQSFDQRAEITHTDIGCVEPLKTIALVQAIIPCSGVAVPLSQTAVPAPTAFWGGNANFTGIRTAPAQDAGFLFYIKGRLFVIELEGGQLPAEGTEWTMRDYVGAISGGTGVAGDFGEYTYTLPETQAIPFTAAGARAAFRFDVENRVVASTAAQLANVHTVPDPYYVTSAFEATTTSKIIKFVNLPEQATIRIYTTSGVLVRVLQHSSTAFGGEATWDVRNRNNQFVASGVYFYHVEAENGETTVARMTIINYAQ